MAPHKFLQPHVPVCLGAGGQLVLVCPHRPTEGQLPLVELHSLEVSPDSPDSLWFPPLSCPFHPNGVKHHSLPQWTPQPPFCPRCHLASSPHGLSGLILSAISIP